MGLASVAQAQNPPPPKFELPKPPEAAKAPPPDVAWKVQSKGGLLLTSGNSRSQTATLQPGWLPPGGEQQAVPQRRAGLRALDAVGRRDLTRPVRTPTAIERGPAVTTTNHWITKGRYDRFFTLNNAGYVLGQLGADKIAGKRLYGGGQLGYSRQLLKNEQHTIVAEAGLRLLVRELRAVARQDARPGGHPFGARCSSASSSR